MADYVGPKPVTPSDKKMAKAHLKATKKLLKAKIKDHKKAVSGAPNQASVNYNKSHLTGHQKDLSQVNQSLVTVMKGKMMANTTQKTGSYKGKSNALGGGGRFQQLVDKGVSPGLAAAIGRKKYGKAKMASMSAAGKK